MVLTILFLKVLSENKSKNKIISLESYKLSDKDPFMCKDQLAYFKLKLEKWRSEVVSDSEISTYKIMNAQHLVIEEKAIEKIESNLE